MMNGFCVNVIAVKTGPVKFDREHQSEGGETKTIGGLNDHLFDQILLMSFLRYLKKSNACTSNEVSNIRNKCPDDLR